MVVILFWVRDSLVKCTLVFAADDSLISGPLSLKSYLTVADFMDKKTKFSFKEGATVQVMQKDKSGEYYCIVCGL